MYIANYAYVMNVREKCLDSIVINKFMNLCLNRLCLLSTSYRRMPFLVNRNFAKSFFVKSESEFLINFLTLEQDQRSLRVMPECSGVWTRRIIVESQ